MLNLTASMHPAAGLSNRSEQVCHPSASGNYPAPPQRTVQGGAFVQAWMSPAAVPDQLTNTQKLHMR